jgi:hypothetical protein
VLRFLFFRASASAFHGPGVLTDKTTLVAEVRPTDLLVRKINWTSWRKVCFCSSQVEISKKVKKDFAESAKK